MRFLNGYLLSGIGLGIIGLLYYANFRQPLINFDVNPLFSLFHFTDEPIILPRYIDEWIPSFLHVIGMSLFTFGLYVGLNQQIGNTSTKNSALSSRLYLYVPIAWLAIDLMFEFLQAGKDTYLLAAGNFEWVDIAAMTVSAVLSIAILSRHQFATDNQAPQTSAIAEKSESRTNAFVRQLNNNISQKLVISSSLLVGSYMMLGSYVVLEDEMEPCQFPNGDLTTECVVDPIYMPLLQLRALTQILVNPDLNLDSLNVLSQEFYGIRNAGKLYVYGDLLFINERLRGTYVFDNSDPSNPSYLAYLKVMGNQDIVVHNDIVYLDSYLDIVSIDLTVFKDLLSDSGTTTQTEVYMHTNRDVLSILDGRSYLSLGDLPEGVDYQNLLYTNGKDIIIGYTNYRGDTFYFWDLEL